MSGRWWLDSGHSFLLFSSVSHPTGRTELSIRSESGRWNRSQKVQQDIPGRESAVALMFRVAGALEG